MPRLKSIRIEIYKCIQNINPPFLDMFHIRETHHNLRDSNTLIQPKVNTIKFGILSFSYHGSNILERPAESPFLHGNFRSISPTRQLRNQSPLPNDPARLSFQLREVLNGSMHSFTGSLVPVDESILDSSPIDQYNILNEYHSAREQNMR